MRTAPLLIAFLLFASHTMAQSSRYAAHSVLAEGQWAKIRVPATGFYQLTDELIRQAGFDDPAKVKVYGLGGAPQQEKLTASYLAQTDDLKQVPTAWVDGARLMFGVGPVNYVSPTDTTRTLNPYSNDGYYFLTDQGGEPLLVDSATMVDDNYPNPIDYHSLYEVDDFAWIQGGRDLYDRRLFGPGVARSYTLPAYGHSGKLVVKMSYTGYCDAVVELNGQEVGSILVNERNSSTSNKQKKAYPDEYCKAVVDTWSFHINDMLSDSNTVTIRQKSGADMRLDYVMLVSATPKPLPQLTTATLPVPELVGTVECQDRHSDPQADMVIIIPTSQKFRNEAERLAQLHRDYDGLRVNIVTAGELYNEFSAGTPDANAYRRYMKMLYDRADTPENRPRYLLLFGDGAWDNRMVMSDWRSMSPDDFLLCYESENSYSQVDCYVSDDYYCILDDGEGSNVLACDIDAAVGRLPARTQEEARTIVDKLCSYRTNQYAGPWQNTLCFMGDDGDKNRHMADAEQIVKSISRDYPAFNYKKIYWDAYREVIGSTGETYPEAQQLIKQQMQDGALVMNYTGHGAPGSFSHEYVMTLNDFKEPDRHRAPLWVTASCDITPFDGSEENIGEITLFNRQGGAIAFLGTTRTVYATYNLPMNRDFMTYVLGSSNGKRNAIGEALRLAKNGFIIGAGHEKIVNKQQFVMLGDPAMVLAAPTLKTVVDSINGQPVTTDVVQHLSVGSTVSVSGHIEGIESFAGTVSLTMFDAEQTIRGRRNNTSVTDTAFVYTDRLNTLSVGMGTVSNGSFSATLAVPRDMSYAEGTGLIQVYALSDDKLLTAHGECGQFDFTSDGEKENDGQGPDIVCFLNNDSFTDGACVAPESRFYAELYDADGINVSDCGFGHQMELVVDGKPGMTYNLNSYFSFDMGDYRRGTVSYVLPPLLYGRHQLLFRAWDVLNNSSVAEFFFVVEDPQGINGIDSDNEDKQTIYDASGRRVNAVKTMHKGIYLFRDHCGRVKKMVAGGQ